MMLADRGPQAAHFGKLPLTVAERPDLSPAAKVLYAILAYHDRTGNGAWPGKQRLAEMTGVDRSTVLRALTQLEAAGLVDIERRTGRSSVYHLRKGAQNAPGGVHEGGREMRPEVNASCAGSGREMRREVGGTCAASGRGMRPKRERDNIEDTATERTAVAEGAARDNGNGTAEACAGMLRRAGVNGNGTLARLARKPGLTPAKLVPLLLAARGKAKPGGWIRSRLETDEAVGLQTATPEQIQAAGQTGLLKRLGGHDLSGDGVALKWNDRGVHVQRGGKTVASFAPADLAAVPMA